ncbi:MAG: M28 family peptidase [Candidatus Latescibacteria bacterium]|nr:M28 family peptidase [Candidatus Latescibacterota bacterium]
MKRYKLIVPCILALYLIPSHTMAQDEPIMGFWPNELARQQSWEESFRALPQPDSLRAYMRWITEEPHHAGGPGSKKVADYVLNKFRSWGLDASIETFEALMPVPTERRLEMLEPTAFVAGLKEPAVSWDKDSSDEGQLPGYNAYSADGDVTGQLVYVNYGVPEDYEALEKLGIDVAGKIVIVRYGRSWRGIKPRLAADRGAIGCLIYSDPEDDGYVPGDILPDGPYRPWNGIQRGSTMDMPTYPGDPLSPGWASEAGGRKLDMADAETLVKIPVMPISYSDALPLLENLGGPVAPSDWRGGLPMTYHVGPGPSKIRLTLKFDWAISPVYNVIARIEGSTFPDEWVIYGNHHDAWVNGASDPTSGNVALMEVGRAFGALLKEGWRPKRTIVLTSWDAEEWGLIGSTEWAEKHQVELREKAVAYINTDSNGKGWLNAGGSHSLERFVTEVARDVTDPKTGDSVLDAAKKRRQSQAGSEEKKTEIAERSTLAIGALGSGSDYTVFIDFLTIASLNMGYGGASPGGVYHSAYDSFDWYTKYSDTTFEYGRALSQTTGTAVMRLASASVLPFSFSESVSTIGGYVDEIEVVHKGIADAPALDFAALRSAVDSYGAAASRYESAMNSAGMKSPGPSAMLARVNQLLYKTERSFGYEEGLPKRPWYKHQIYAPGLDTGYGVKTIPGVREGIERNNWDESRTMMNVVTGALTQVAEQVNSAAIILESW